MIGEYMKTLFLEAPYTGKVELCKETLDYLTKQEKNNKIIKTVALYASVQFCNQLEKIKQQLQEAKIKIITSQARRTHVEGQLLGCDNDKEALNLPEEQWKEIDAFLYIGDGRFHPLALIFAQKDTLEEEIKIEEKKERKRKKDRKDDDDNGNQLKSIKEVICNDPMAEKMKVMAANDIKKLLQKYWAFYLKFLTAQSVGVIVTIKPGQQQLRASFELEKKFPDKKFYYFIDNVISFDQLENFPFIQAWINTACPRIGFDDQEKFVRGVINLRDAMSENVFHLQNL